jgi:tRNA threonylcarbamoyl adenosine modification protein (Sua5/YciO/YrdC/YwlC family)
VKKKLNVPVFSSLSDPALAEMLRAGAVGVLLTDTVYGLVGSAKIPETAKRVIDVKGRKHKPGTVVTADVQQLIDLGVPREHVYAAERFWPGAVSVVLPTKPGLEYLDIGMKSLAVRVPDKPELLNLLHAVGPLLTTSANRPNEPTVKSIEEARDIFSNHVDFYVDGGFVESPLASTVIRIENEIIEILRQGAVTVTPK